MKIRFFTLLSIVVIMFISGLVTAHAQPVQSSDDSKPVVCIGDQQHEVYAGSEQSEISGGSNVYSCLKDQQRNPNVRVCDLSEGFKQCLSANADVLVKHDPKQPKAWDVFRLYVTQDNKQTYVDILTPKNGAIAGCYNGVCFNLAVIDHDNGQTEVTYTIDTVTYHSNFEKNDWVATSDYKAILQRL